MISRNEPRRPVPAADVTSSMGVRPGAGVLGLAKAEQAGQQAENSSEGTLIVGEGIQVKGEIQSCRRLIVEGKVEASLEARELTVRAEGLYDGTAVVETAEIGGTFTGNLTVKGLLTVESGGRVSGTLRYGDLCIEPGGRLSGDVDLLAAQDESAQKTEAPKADVHEAAKAAVSKAQAKGEAQAAANGAASELSVEGATAR
jgi:cytoskeletal protein CcmA (bactofilin family)